MFTVAAAPLRIPNALITGGGMRSWGWLMRKFSRERSVWAPQYLSAGTWISPKASLSVLVLAAILMDVAWRFLRNCREDLGDEDFEMVVVAYDDVVEAEEDEE